MEHERIDPSTLRASDIYKLMTVLVAPRPIAWVSTVSSEGAHNLAPFSFYQAVCSNPPTIVLGCAWRKDGTPKDTLKNILDTQEFTISHVARDLAQPMVATSGEFEAGFDEWTIADRGQPLTSAPAQVVKPPRVAEAKATLECRLTHAIPLGSGAPGKPSSTIVVAEVVYFTVMPGVMRVDANGGLEPDNIDALAAIGRMGGSYYTSTEDLFAIERPKVPKAP